MRILIGNDDGIGSEGLKALVKELAGEHEIWIAAPMSERSAFSHSVTYFRKRNLARKVEMDGVREAWAIDGTPADCIYYAIHGIMKGQRPDVVISGINYGRNMSSDCVYSGTVAAAGEGMIFGIPAMAVSLCDDTGKDFSIAARAAKEALPILMTDPAAGSYIMNINVPALPAEEIKGFRITELDTAADYAKEVSFLPQENGDILLEVINKPVPVNTEMKESGDVSAVLQGYISVTPLYYDLCAYHLLAQLKKIEQLHL